jgi:hypothetical protein
LEIILRDGKLALATPNAFYSYSDRYKSFIQAFRTWPPEAVLERSNGNAKAGSASVLLLGFGLGSIVELLAARGLRPKAIGVDLDPRLPDLWQRYGRPDVRDQISLVIAEAGAWLADNARGKRLTFDLICVDLFVDDRVPPSCSEPDFMAHLQAALAPDGVLYWSRLKEEPEKERHDFERTFHYAFPGADSTLTGGNRVWYAPGDAALDTKLPAGTAQQS